ncbi:MAG: class I SAM-dependent methyltransferase [Actinomycetota bacterium]
MQTSSSHSEALRRAYDADVERRGAMTPDEWRTDLIDEFAVAVRTSGGRSVLELGCGTGQLAQRMASHDLDIVATDLSPGNVQRTRERGVNAQIADFADLPFPDDTFDAAFGINSLIHAAPEELPAVLAEISRVLRPGGRLLMVVWGGVDHQGPLDDEWLDPPRYFSFYTDEAALALDTPGFRRISFETLDVTEAGDDIHPQVITLEAI